MFGGFFRRCFRARGSIQNTKCQSTEIYPGCLSRSFGACSNPLIFIPPTAAAGSSQIQLVHPIHGAATFDGVPSVFLVLLVMAALARPLRSPPPYPPEHSPLADSPRAPLVCRSCFLYPPNRERMKSPKPKPLDPLLDPLRPSQQLNERSCLVGFKLINYCPSPLTANLLS